MTNGLTPEDREKAISRLEKCRLEKECIRIDPRKKKLKRLPRLKDLMKYRTTVEQGLTSRQVFNEVYFDIVEETHGITAMLEDEYQKRRKYLARMIKLLQKTDEFRWLSLVPCKNEKGKIKEYRWVNIKARESDGSDSKLLEEVNEFWHKHAEGSIAGLERKRKCLKKSVNPL